MAVPTAAECKLNLSFDMVAKTMTVSVSSTVENDVVDNGLLYHIYYATLVDPLGDSVDIDEIYSEGAGDNVLSQTFDAPLDADGKVLNGAYSIFIPLCVVSDGTPTDYDDVDSSFTLSYTKPTVVLTATVDCITPSFVSTDATDYRVIDPTSQGYITPTTVSYEHNLNYPATSNGYPTNATETDDLIITRGANEFYQGTQTAITTHLVSYLFVDGLVVTDTIDGDKETIVDCATLLCGITCGMNTLYTAMQAAKPINNTLYQTLEASFNLNSAKSMLAWMNITCGNSTEATNIIADIRASIGNCCDDCNPADGSPISGV